MEERIFQLVRILDEMRATSTPEEYAALSPQYQVAIEKMQSEVGEYLARHNDAEG